MQEEMLFHVQVGWTSSRPVRPDEHLSQVALLAGSEREAHLVAAQWVLANPNAVMPTSTKTLLVEI